jgi:phenylpropionate dioxygenase-like ring-hydroxylating dioxygenase large terminal subunit
MTRLQLNNAFFDGLDSSICDVNRAVSLPPGCYTDAGFFAFEKRAIFDREWLCVGREAWAKQPGDYFTSSHVREPIVVVRNRDGVLKAFSAVCQHRGALVAEGAGNARSFICPYHHWTYSLDGRLVTAPDMERACDFDTARVALPELKLEVWLGFVFVNFDPAAAPLGPRLVKVAAALAPFDLAHADEPSHAEISGPQWTQKFPWNWKVHFENSNDSYHANKLHKGLNDVMPTSLSEFPEMPADTAGYFRFNGTTEIDAGFNPLNKAILPIFRGLDEQDRRRVIFANVPPSFFIFTRADYVTYVILRAESAEEVWADRGYLVAPGAMQQPHFRERMAMTTANGAAVNQQDRSIDAAVQRGLRSRFAPRGRYSWQEGGQIALNRWLVDRYRAARSRAETP